MRYREITEANLKLVKGNLPRLRGSYAAFIITMRPEDFLKLTASPEDFELIANHKFPHDKDRYTRDRDNDKNYGRFEMPYLNVEWPSGKVLGHEGRHRALMVQRSGTNVFPVAIYLRYANKYEVHYEKYNAETEESTDEVEEFGTDRAGAVARADALKRWNDEKRDEWQAAYDSGQMIDFEPIAYYRIRMETLRFGDVKGSPSHNNPDDPWEKKPYQIEDMPKKLIGEWSDDVSVSDYKVGLVKGYSHFR